jgi:hypothetical protein
MLALANRIHSRSLRIALLAILLASGFLGSETQHSWIPAFAK